MLTAVSLNRMAKCCPQSVSIRPLEFWIGQIQKETIYSWLVLMHKVYAEARSQHPSKQRGLHLDCEYGV